MKVVAKLDNTPKKAMHKGTVASIDDGLITISITSQSACASCHAKGTCTSADVKEKEVHIYNHKGKVEVGDQVLIGCKQELGIKALFLGYLLPFLLVLSILIIATIFTDREEIAGISALAVLVPYYFIIYLFKDRIKKTFSFSIEKVIG